MFCSSKPLANININIIFVVKFQGENAEKLLLKTPVIQSNSKTEIFW